MLRSITPSVGLRKLSCVDSEGKRYIPIVAVNILLGTKVREEQKHDASEHDSCKPRVIFPTASHAYTTTWSYCSQCWNKKTKGLSQSTVKINQQRKEHTGRRLQR
jgi:hypothetical protein